jgi:predicted ABC-type ATPase
MAEFTMIAGVNGSGKTTFALDYFKGSNIIFINADSIATSLSPHNPDMSQFRAGKLMIQEVQNCIKNQQNFAIETTLASKNYLKIIKELKSKNWQINLIYLYLPSVELSVQRITERVRNGGHNIKKVDILRRYNRSIDNLVNKYFDVVDNIICIDNYDKDEIIFSKNDILKIYNKNKYQKFMEFNNA